MKKILIPLIIFVMLCLSIAVAERDTYKPREVFDLSIHLTNEFGDVTGASCHSQIRFSNLSVKEELNHNEIGNGWYNATYNVSKTGEYPCMQNCTAGSEFTSGTCDFIIKGDNMGLETFFGLAIILLFYIGLVVFMRLKIFNENGLIKALIILGLAWFMLLPTNLIILFNSDNGSSENVMSMLNLIYQIEIWANYVLSFYIFLWLIISTIKQLQKSGNRRT